MIARRPARAPTAPPDDPRAGYVLVEVVAALAVTLMLVFFAYPRVGGGTTPSRFLALVADAASLLRDARTTALGGKAPVAATFDAARRRLRAGAESVDLPPDVGFEFVAGGNCPKDGARSGIVFRVDGTNCGGVLRFARQDRVVRIRVNWADGHVDVAQGG